MGENIFSLGIFLKLFVLGIIFGLIYEICKLSKIFSKNNIFIVNAINFVYFCVLGMVFCTFLIKYNQGVFNIYAVFAVLCGIIIEQISIGFLFTKFYQVVYNIHTKLKQKIKNTKFGNKLLR